MKDFVADDAERRSLGNPLTPMIDVTFLLLIFFLYSRFRSPEAELGADIPSLGASAVVVEDIEILKRRQILVNIGMAESGDVIAKVGKIEAPVAQKIGDAYAAKTSELIGLLHSRAQAEPESFVILKPGRSVPFGCIVWCFDSARLAGIEDISFAPPEGEGLPDV